MTQRPDSSKPQVTLRTIVDGRSVALVGNSQSILTQKPAELIDRHDVVVRMNRGLPEFIGKDAIGGRTTIWATAKYWPDLDVPKDCRAILWMKLTQLGQRQLQHALRDPRYGALITWSPTLEDECREFVGADPGTGIRMLWYLRTRTQSRSISCFGMDCWERPSHWSGRKNTPNHSPELERAAMLKLL